MINKFKFAMVVFLLVPAMTGTLKAAEEVEIPFHLGKGQLLYEKYCSSCMACSSPDRTRVLRYCIPFTNRRITATSLFTAPPCKAFSSITGNSAICHPWKA